MMILSVDPGKKSGWALLQDGVLLESGEIKIKTMGDLAHRELAAKAANLYIYLLQRHGDVDVFAIENQYVRTNEKVAIDLGQRAGIWIGVCCSQTNTLPLRIYPSEWGKFYKFPKTRKQRKIYAIQLAFAHCPRIPLKDWTDNAAEAYLMGRYAHCKIMGINPLQLTSRVGGIDPTAQEK